LGFDIEYVTKPEVVNPDGTKTKAETAKGFKMVLYTHDHHIVYHAGRKDHIPRHQRSDHGRSWQPDRQR
jgi:hypothetical protein